MFKNIILQHKPFVFLKNSIFTHFLSINGMAGIYIHVPFCAQRCAYCDFYSQTNHTYKDTYVESVVRELGERAGYVRGESIETIYFGGGTPSRLTADDFARIFNAIEFHFDLSTCREVTFEANPDDLTEAYLRSIRMLPFNRISLGVQSFSNSDLCQLNRRHDRQKAIDTVHRCRKTGLTNISIDLMYGLPGQTTEAWELNLEEAFGLGVPHFSAYHLSYEEGTPLYRAMKKGAVCPVDEDTSALLYSILTEKAKEAGYVHYEISNFCFPGCFSKHNTSYWMGKKYLGVGPSAHSYDGSSRQWNVASLPQYCNALLHNRSYFEQEFPTVPMRYNEYVMTALRTMWGVEISCLQDAFGKDYVRYFDERAQPYLQCGKLQQTGNTIRIPEETFFTSDGIICDLMI